MGSFDPDEWYQCERCKWWGYFGSNVPDYRLLIDDDGCYETPFYCCAFGATRKTKVLRLQQHLTQRQRQNLTQSTQLLRTLVSRKRMKIKKLLSTPQLDESPETNKHMLFHTTWCVASIAHVRVAEKVRSGALLKVDASQCATFVLTIVHGRHSFPNG